MLFVINDQQLNASCAITIIRTEPMQRAGGWSQRYMVGPADRSSAWPSP